MMTSSKVARPNYRCPTIRPTNDNNSLGTDCSLVPRPNASDRLHQRKRSGDVAAAMNGSVHETSHGTTVSRVPRLRQ